MSETLNRKDFELIAVYSVYRDSLSVSFDWFLMNLIYLMNNSNELHLLQFLLTQFHYKENGSKIKSKRHVILTF
jgi:hypothetical protein